MATATTTTTTSIKSIIQYENTDIYIRQNNVEHLGFDKTKTFEEMIELAKQHKCIIISKNGGGKWYLKGQGKNYTTTKEKMIEKTGKFPRIKCWLIEYTD